MNDKQQLAAMGEHMREMGESELRITKDARIGGVVFKAGVKASTVIEAAYRAAEFHQPNPKAFDSLMGSISRQSSSIGFEVPDGWKLVPTEPSEEMITSSVMSRIGARTKEELDCNSGFWAARDCMAYYRLMLAAAPEYKP